MRWLALFVLPAGVWLACTDVWLPQGASTVSLLHAAESFHQCSREAPIPDGSFWLPSGAQIRAIDAKVAQLGREGASVYRYSHTPGYPFMRQYIGFTRKGERLIYVTVTTDDWRYMSRLHDSGETGTNHTLSERRVHYRELLLPEKPQLICDGGTFTWGIVFNPQAGIFEPPVFNGGGGRIK